MPLVRTRTGRIEHDLDLVETGQRNKAVYPFGSDRDAQPFGPLQAVTLRIDADKCTHFEDIRQAHDLDHQIGADIARSDDRNLGLAHCLSPKLKAHSPIPSTCA